MDRDYAMRVMRAITGSCDRRALTEKNAHCRE